MNARLNAFCCNNLTTGWGGVSWGRFGRFGGGHRRKPVGGSKNLSARHTTSKNPLHPFVFNDLTTGSGVVSWGRFGRFGGGHRCKPVGVSKVPSTFVRQFDRCVTPHASARSSLPA